MGTTVSALLMVDDYAVIAHIGDSRIYLYRDDALTQITADHTFVQRLVDSGRITPEEARYHPRRSVLNAGARRHGPRPRSRHVHHADPAGRPLAAVLRRLVGRRRRRPHREGARRGLAPGARPTSSYGRPSTAVPPDNVTIVLVDVGGQHPVFIGTPTIVGSASNPSGIEVPAARAGRSGWLHPNRQAANEPTHFEPAVEFLEDLIEEDRRRARLRRLGWFVGFALVILAIAVGLMLAYNWTQTRYFVGADSDTVVVYQGVQQSIGPITLSTPYEDTEIPLADLPEFDRATVEGTISAQSLADAQTIVERLRETAGVGE